MNFKHFGMVDSSKYPWASAAIAVEIVVASSKCFGDAVLNKKKKMSCWIHPKLAQNSKLNHFKLEIVPSAFLQHTSQNFKLRK